VLIFSPPATDGGSSLGGALLPPFPFPPVPGIRKLSRKLSSLESLELKSKDLLDIHL
jgi:hypothetical protein